jgi:hypothetical protein
MRPATEIDFNRSLGRACVCAWEAFQDIDESNIVISHTKTYISRWEPKHKLNNNVAMMIGDPQDVLPASPKPNVKKCANIKYIHSNI